MLYLWRMSTLKPMNADRITLLQTFVRIAESGSLSAAARQLETSQPTVSRRLRALETLLGSRLILRTTHAMTLTDDGERCYQQARQLVANWQQLEDEMAGSNDDPVGLLRVRVPHAFGQDQLIDPLGRYLRSWPRMNIEWSLNDSSPDFVRDGLDCAIHVGTLTAPSVVAVLLAEIPRILVAAPALLQQHAPVSEVADLVQLPWLALTAFYQKEISLTQRETQHQQQLSINPRMSSDSLYAVRRAALDGLGVAIVSGWVVAEDIAAGHLQHLLPEWEAHPLPIWLLYPWASYYPTRLRKFLELMREVTPQLTETRQPARR